MLDRLHARLAARKDHVATREESGEAWVLMHYPYARLLLETLEQDGLVAIERLSTGVCCGKLFEARNEALQELSGVLLISRRHVKGAVEKACVEVR